MTDLPTLKQLRYLKALEDTGSFSLAAGREGISQPSLSLQIGNLEERLGLRLVERGRGPIKMTPAGREVLIRAQPVLDGIQAIVDLSAQLATGVQGTIRLGSSPTLGPYLLPHVAGALHRSYPDLRLYIREDTPRALTRDLQRGVHDVILTQLPVSDSHLVVHRLLREPLFLVAAADHPLAALSEISDADLAGQPILTLGPGFTLHEQISALCQRTGAHLQRDYEGTSLDALRQMAAMGMGATFLPALYLQSEVGDRDSALAVRRAKGNRLHRSIGLVWRPTTGSDAAFLKIAAAIRDVARNRFGGLVTVET